MDVGDPSNFVRILELYDNNFEKLKEHLTSYSYTDSQTRMAIKEIHKQSGYISDPHGAVGYLGLKDYLKKHPDHYGLFLETAHPVKFLDVVEQTLNLRIPLPEQIEALLRKEKQTKEIHNYAELKSFLINS